MDSQEEQRFRKLLVQSSILSDAIVDLLKSRNTSPEAGRLTLLQLLAQSYYVDGLSTDYYLPRISKLLKLLERMLKEPSR